MALPHSIFSNTLGFSIDTQQPLEQRITVNQQHLIELCNRYINNPLQYLNVSFHPPSFTLEA